MACVHKFVLKALRIRSEIRRLSLIYTGRYTKSPMPPFLLMLLMLLLHFFYSFHFDINLFVKEIYTYTDADTHSRRIDNHKNNNGAFDGF